jgi:hypothetical protein
MSLIKKAHTVPAFRWPGAGAGTGAAAATATAAAATAAAEGAEDAEDAA